MRILYLHQHFATRGGSVGTRSYEFARLLQARGHHVTILCGWWDRSGLPFDANRRVTEHDIDGLRVLVLNVAYSQDMSFSRRILAFVWFMLLATWVALRERDHDVIFATSTPLTIGVPAMIASLVNRTPFVFEVRDLWPEIPIGLGILTNPVFVALARALEWITYRRARHIVALSPGFRDGIVANGISPERITIIPNASDNDLFAVPASAGEAFRAQHGLGDRPLVVYAGAFGRVNNIPYLVRLADQVRGLDERVGFVLIGSGSEEAAARTLAEELGVLDENLWILLPVARQEMPAVLSAATIATSTVIPNPVMFNNSANKFFDILASGRPAAINHEGWQADLLRDTGAGLVLDGTDLDAAAQALVAALHDADGLQAMGQAARQVAEERFDREKLAGELEGVLLAAADQAPRQPSPRKTTPSPGMDWPRALAIGAALLVLWRIANRVWR